MAAELIGFRDSPRAYTDYTIQTFPDWRALDAFAKKIDAVYPDSVAKEANENYKKAVDNLLINGQSGTSRLSRANFGLFGKAPNSFDDGMKRDHFVYYEEYKKIKEAVDKKIREELAKSSVAEAMKPRLVFNDRELGEFVYERAAMSLVPELYYYSPSQKREINANEEKVIPVGDKYKLEADGSEVVFVFKVDLPDGGIEYVEADGEESLLRANSLGIINVSSNNKKVYLYKEKKPKVHNAIKIIVGLTAGGFTNWDNDFYTGVAAGCALEILESLGYTVHIEVVLGGGRCQGCRVGSSPGLNFPTKYGRRFFSFAAKTFDDPVDMDGLLYTMCDPSFHRIKFIPYLNYFYSLYGDAIDTAANPAMTWHGIAQEDMTNPIGMYIKHRDHKAGNDNLIHFYIHQVKTEADVIAQILDLVLTAENINMTVLKKAGSHEFEEDE